MIDSETPNKQASRYLIYTFYSQSDQLCFI